MSAAPDVAGIYAALAALPDRTPAQQRAYAVSLSALSWSDRDALDEAFGEGVESVLEQLREVKLSKVARARISEVLAVEWSD